jgi:hypothetical protein
MMKQHGSIRIFFLLALSLFTFGCWTTTAEASEITYLFSGTDVYGVYNGAEFNDAQFSMALYGDTTGVTIDSLGPFNVNLTGTMNVWGSDISLFGASFLEMLYAFVDPFWEMVGFGTDSQGDLIDITVPGSGLDTYDLTTAFGPILASTLKPGTGIFSSGGDINLNTGLLNFEDMDNVVFSAVPGHATPQVPEPATILMLSLGLVGLYGAKRKFIRKQI